MTTLASIRKRQGIPPPTTEAEHAEYERLKAERRAKNVASAIEVLNRNYLNWVQARAWPQVEFKVASGRDRPVSYYPEVGTWFTHDGERRFGCRNLVKYLKGEVV